MRLISSALPDAGFVGLVLDRNVPRVDGAVWKVGYVSLEEANHRGRSLFNNAAMAGMQVHITLTSASMTP